MTNRTQCLTEAERYRAAIEAAICALEDTSDTVDTQELDEAAGKALRLLKAALAGVG